MRCYRRILAVKWQDRRSSSNEEMKRYEQLYNEKKQWWIQSE